MIEIRTFVERDRTGMRELFGRAGEGAVLSELWGHEESEAAVYLEPYMDLEPDSLFVALEDGVPVGYLAGCLDTSMFPSESERMDRAVRRYRLVLHPKSVAFFARAAIDTVWATLRRAPSVVDFDDSRWPAHLHMNVEPHARGTGVADGLMRCWLQRLRETGSPGCHLQTIVENVRAVRFFERMGFVRYGPAPLVPGVRHGGKRVHQQTMVWNP